MPRSVAMGEGRYVIGDAAWRTHPYALARSSIAHKLAQLSAELQGDEKIPEYSVRVGEPASEAPLVSRRGGYGLAISARGLSLRGADADGLFWGLVTCERLLLESGGKSLPELVISDWPEIAVRIHHDDVSRKQVSRLADFKRIVRLLSSFKISHYTLYLEDMLHLKSFPDIGEGRGKLTPDEVAAIVREGELHNVEVFPTFQLIGHQENLLALPKYAHLGRAVFQSMSSLDPAKPEVREFLIRAIDDVCALFPSKLFGMGFDETQGVDRQTFVAHANWCAEQLAKRGKTPLMWADMIYNHFGCETLQLLHPSIVPINWTYEPSLPVPHQRELEAQGRPVWGYAGYNNWCAFMPDFERAKDYLSTWAKQLEGRSDAALAASMWGDDGYENSRDLCWNLFAYFAEASWSGPDADRASFERRFQRAFYGAELPELEHMLGSLASRLSHPPGWYWRLHRRNANALFRLATAEPAIADQMRADEQVLEAALTSLGASRAAARREAEHLDHVAVGLERLLSVTRRMAFAHRHLANADPVARARDGMALADELIAVRDRYRDVWLRHNKSENVEVSLAVFDRVADSFRALAASSARMGDNATFAPMDLGERADTCFLDIAGIPIGIGAAHGVPFRFAGIDRTHAKLAGSNKVVGLGFEPASLRDLHLVVTAPKPADEQPMPALRVELSLRGKSVFSEDLSLITHLCDWWAPMGEHMWAGGGYTYVDRSRVTSAFAPDSYYGLMDVHGFAIPEGVVADRLTLTSLIGAEINVFAVTLERR